jgi:superfamily I DNA and RNA helicase
VKNLREDELAAEDIIVINPDPLKTRKAVADARARLYTEKVNSSLAGVSGSPDIFFQPDVVTFTGIFRAKGNEAAMVYIINAHDCFDSFFPAGVTRVRNQLFTAMTRSKAWVRVLGVGRQMDALMEEYNRIREADYTLNFTYPDEARRQELRIINRDLTKTEQDRVSRRIDELSKVLEALEHGDVRIEDLPTSVRNRLRDFFG